MNDVTNSSNRVTKIDLFRCIFIEHLPPKLPHMTPLNISFDVKAVAIVTKPVPAKDISVFVHELRNPLNNIALSVEMLESLTDDKDLKIYLDIITRSSARMSGLINELLKPKEEEAVLPQKHSIQQLLDEVVEITKDSIALKNIAVIKDYDTEDARIFFDRPKLKIALTNIIVNAIDAMTPGKGELRLMARSTANRYRVQIEDNGCGIIKKYMSKIFKPYFTLKPGGIGLGLAATYDILRSNRVELHVESEEGEGTRFDLLFEKERNTKFSIGQQDRVYPIKQISAIKTNRLKPSRISQILF